MYLYIYRYVDKIKICVAEWHLIGQLNLKNACVKWVIMVQSKSFKRENDTSVEAVSLVRNKLWGAYFSNIYNIFQWLPHKHPSSHDLTSHWFLKFKITNYIRTVAANINTVMLGLMEIVKIIMGIYILHHRLGCNYERSTRHYRWKFDIYWVILELMGSNSVDINMWCFRVKGTLAAEN